MKLTLLIATALLTLTSVAAEAAATPKAPAGYIYLRDGTLVRMPGPGVVYDAKDQLITRPYACVPPTSRTSVSSGAKVTVGFPCPNIYAGYDQLPASYVPSAPQALGSCAC